MSEIFGDGSGRLTKGKEITYVLSSKFFVSLHSKEI